MGEKAQAKEIMQAVIKNNISTSAGFKKWHETLFDKTGISYPKYQLEAVYAAMKSIPYAKGGKVRAYKADKFTINGADYYPGFEVPGEHWNGWNMPVFEKETALKILKDMGMPHHVEGGNIIFDPSWYEDQPKDEYEEEAAEPFEITVNGKKKTVYAIGTSYWVWFRNNNDEGYKKGGNLSRDRKFKSQQPWEQAYKRKTSPKNPRYKKYYKGGKAAKAVAVSTDVQYRKSGGGPRKGGFYYKGGKTAKKVVATNTANDVQYRKSGGGPRKGGFYKKGGSIKSALRAAKTLLRKKLK
jgi:hypothetical protein